MTNRLLDQLGMLNNFGTGLGGLAGLGQQATAALYNDQTYTTSNTITIGGGPDVTYVTEPVKEDEQNSGPESALTWLDRRVNEIRVAL